MRSVCRTNGGTAVSLNVEGLVTSTVPGSALQLHPRTLCIVDEAAARLLTRIEHYRWVSQNKDR